MSTGSWIREARKSKNINQKALADHVGVSQPTVSQWELGRSEPRPDQLAALEALLGASSAATSTAPPRPAPAPEPAAKSPTAQPKPAPKPANGTKQLDFWKREGRKLTLRQLESHLWGAADILRGSIDAEAYKHYIFGLLFYKRLCDVWQEEYDAAIKEYDGDEEEARAPEEHRFQIPEGHFWADVRRKSHDIGQELTMAFQAIEDANHKLQGIFQDVDFGNKHRFPDPLIERLLHHFEKHGLSRAEVEPDMLGQAYEYLIKKFADASGLKGGDFFTPRRVVELMVECLRPEEGMHVYDPTCGSGGMLLECAAFMEREGLDPRTLVLYGQEKNLNTWAICRMNMILHGIDGAVIERGDTLRDPKHLEAEGSKKIKTFDVVLANPPFSQKSWGHSIWSKGDPYGRDRYGCPPAKNGDLAFVQHMIASLKPGGRMAVVVPHGDLFRGGDEGRIRRGMVEDDLIEAVIGLPQNLFYGAGIPAAILIVWAKGSKPADRRGKVLFINADAEYWEGRAQNELRPEHIEKIASAFHGFEDIDRYAAVVTLEQIAENDFNLNIRRYADNAPPPEPHDVRAHLQGGVPRAEIESKRPLFEAQGLDLEKLFVETYPPCPPLPTREGGNVDGRVRSAPPSRAGKGAGGLGPASRYLDFAPPLTTKADIKAVVEADEGVRARERAMRDALDEWWSRRRAGLERLPDNGDMMRLRTDLLDTFKSELVEVGLLDRFEVAGIVTTWWSETYGDLRAARDQGFEGVVDGWIADILAALESKEKGSDPKDHKLVGRLLSDYRDRIAELESRKAELAGVVKAGKSTSDDDDDDEDDDKPTEAEVKAAKAEQKRVNAKLKGLNKAFVDHLLSEREALTPEGCRDLVLKIAKSDLDRELDRRITAHRQEVISAIENWWDKYRVTLRDLEAQRDEAAKRLNAFVKELGYEL